MEQQAAPASSEAPAPARAPAVAGAPPATISTVLRNRIETHYASDDTWYLLNRFLPLVEHFGRLEAHNGGRYHWLQRTVILTSPLTAFLVGAVALTSNPWEALLKAGALLTALVVTALTALLHAFNYLTKSVQYRNAKENLIAEFFAMDSGIGQYAELPDSEKLVQFKANCESMVHGINTDWASLQTPSHTSGGG